MEALKMSKDIENYSIQECYDELAILESPKLPPEQSMYHDMALDVIESRKQRIKKRLLQFEQSLTELEELKKTVKELLDIPITVSTFSGTSRLIKIMNKLERLVGDKDE